jgi:hypothetical protein
MILGTLHIELHRHPKSNHEDGPVEYHWPQGRKEEGAGLERLRYWLTAELHAR